MLRKGFAPVIHQKKAGAGVKNRRWEQLQIRMTAVEDMKRTTGSNHKAGLCLNVGCGLSPGPDWLNIDSSYSLRVARIPFVGQAIARSRRLPAWPS